MYLKFLTLLFGLLVVFPSSGFAGGLPKLPAGEHYYCTGRKHSVFRFGHKIISEEPEVFAVFRLKPSDELVVSEKYKPCIIDEVNEKIARSLMNGFDDWILTRTLFFRMNMNFKGKKMEAKISTGGVYSYETSTIKGYPVRSIEYCGVVNNSDEFGLIEVGEKCLGKGYNYLGINQDYKNDQVIQICGSEDCILRFFHHGFGVNVIMKDKSYRKDWKEFVDFLKKEIDERMVIHISPERCFGPLICSEIVNYNK